MEQSRTQRIRALRETAPGYTITGHNGRRDFMTCEHEGCFEPCDVYVDSYFLCFPHAEEFAQGLKSADVTPLS